MSLLDTASLIVTPNGYKEGKLYSVIPSDGSGDMSVTRATTATRVNSAGLVELVPYNLFTWSEDYTNANWIKENATISANAITAPNGTLTADLITSSSSSFSDILQATAQSSGNTYTLSCYAKKGSSDWIFLRLTFAAAAPRVWFNVNTGAIGTIGSGLTATIESVGDGWYRCSITGTASATPPADRIDIALANADASTSPNVGNSAYIWGSQLNEGTIKDYQKTETRLNIPRLDYSNGTCPSLLVEPQRTNLFKYSANLADSNWSTYAASGTITRTANYAAAPDGTTTATRIQNSGGDPIQWTYQNIALASNGIISMYVKRTGATNQTFRFFSNNGATFSSNFTATDTWQRFEFAVGSNGSALPFGITTDSSGTAADILVWGAQIEIGSYATSYIPTTSASVTRNADVISKTGISSLIGQTQGAVFIDLNIDSSFAQNDMRFINVGDGTAANWYFIGTNAANQIRFYYRTSNTAYVSFTTTLTDGHHKLAYAYANGDYVAYVDGTLVHSDNTIVVGSASQLNLGNDFGNFSPSKQFINAAALWKTRLTNTQLAQLTTI